MDVLDDTKCFLPKTKIGGSLQAGKAEIELSLLALWIVQGDGGGLAWILHRDMQMIPEQFTKSAKFSRSTMLDAEEDGTMTGLLIHNLKTIIVASTIKNISISLPGKTKDRQDKLPILPIMLIRIREEGHSIGLCQKCLRTVVHGVQVIIHGHGG